MRSETIRQMANMVLGKRRRANDGKAPEVISTPPAFSTLTIASLATTVSTERLISILLAMKRNASPVLLGIPSQYHPSVTLYEPSAEPPRRSKRIKVKEEVEVVLPRITESKKAASTQKRVKKTVLKVEEEGTTGSTIAPRLSTPSTSPRKAKPIPQFLAVPHPAPTGWKEAYDAIKQMREHIVAPVDTMGCEQAQYKETDPRVRLSM